MFLQTSTPILDSAIPKAFQDQENEYPQRQPLRNSHSQENLLQQKQECNQNTMPMRSQNQQQKPVCEPNEMQMERGEDVKLQPMGGQGTMMPGTWRLGQ